MQLNNKQLEIFIDQIGKDIEKEIQKEHPNWIFSIQAYKPIPGYIIGKSDDNIYYEIKFNISSSVNDIYRLQGASKTFIVAFPSKDNYTLTDIYNVNKGKNTFLNLVLSRIFKTYKDEDGKTFIIRQGEKALSRLELFKNLIIKKCNKINLGVSLSEKLPDALSNPATAAEYYLKNFDAPTNSLDLFAELSIKKVWGDNLSDDGIELIKLNTVYFDYQLVKAYDREEFYWNLPTYAILLSSEDSQHEEEIDNFEELINKWLLHIKIAIFNLQALPEICNYIEKAAKQQLLDLYPDKPYIAKSVKLVDTSFLDRDDTLVVRYEFSVKPGVILNYDIDRLWGIPNGNTQKRDIDIWAVKSEIEAFLDYIKIKERETVGV